MVLEAVHEYEAGTMVEARCAHDAGKLECLVQAIEYQLAGNRNAPGWIDSSRAALVIGSALDPIDLAR